MGIPVRVKDAGGVPRQCLEDALVDMMEDMRRLEQKISLKADEVVFTMAVSHRKEIDRLQDEIIELHEEVRQLKRTQKELHYKNTLLLSTNKFLNN
ncbi:hypothetical protein [Thalassobacillus pellis]|uniref:hypothetical protein n=1 Tax=Thalassobacillus pellis TaxID=748008 RepID=UPI0019619361|nr:hypothetical protein [Thalassobacillus pellis]MBM7552504.1 hypothetical protein [Thalassobacillus pellis]